MIELLAALGAAAALSTPVPPPMTACPQSGFFQPCVTLRPDGVEPSSVSLVPGQGVWFFGERPAVVGWEGSSCADVVRTTLPTPGTAPCRFFTPGRYAFTVAGFTGVATVEEPEWATLEASATTVVFGDSVELRGTTFAAPHYGGPPPVQRQVLVSERSVFGERLLAAVPAPFASWPARSIFSMWVSPRATAWYRVRAGGPEVRVDVRPRVEVRRERGGLVVRLSSARLVRGSTVVLQRRAADGSWRGVSARTVGARGVVRFRPVRRGAIVRAYVRERDGVHAEAWSKPLRVP